MQYSPEIRILVVDDEVGILEAMRVFLELKGFLVETAESAQRALELVESGHFHIALLDIRMPDVDGIELLESLKKKQGDMVVIMMTALVSMAKALTTRLYGASDFVLKPFEDTSELEEVLERAVFQVNRWGTVLESLRQSKKENMSSR